MKERDRDNMNENYFICKNCQRTLLEEELMTHLEYDERELKRSWASVGDHSEWWYRKIAPLKLKDGEIVMVCRFCGEIHPEGCVPSIEGKGIADLRRIMRRLASAEGNEAELLVKKKEELEEMLYQFNYSGYILNTKNVREKINTTSGTFYLYSDGSIRYEDVLRKKGHYYKVPVYAWEKVYDEYAEPTSLYEFFNEEEGWLKEGAAAKFDYKKVYASRIAAFNEIDTYLLKRRLEALEVEIARIKEILGEMKGN